MGRKFINPKTSIEWSKNYDFSVDVRGLVRAGLNGTLTSSNASASSVAAAIPNAPPSAIVGSAYAAILTRAGFSFSSDDSGIIEISATYEGTQTSQSNVGDPGGDGENVRYELRGQSVERDITTHPSFANYSDADKQNIALLISGDAYPNPAYDSESTSGLTSWEFVRKEDEKIFHVPFSSTGPELRPIEMARRIVRGIRTYYGPTISATRSRTQQIPLTSQQIDQLGKIFKAGEVAGIATPEGRDWLLAGFTQTNSTSNSYQISEEFLLSDEGGADLKIYDLANG